MIKLQKLLQEQRALTKKLEDSEKHYRSFFDISTDAIWCFETSEPIRIDQEIDEIIRQIYASGVLVDCNDRMAKMYGFENREAIIGSRLEDLLVPGDSRNVEFLRNFIQNHFALSEGISFEPDLTGNLRVFANRFVGLIEDGYLVRAWGVQQDITKQNKSENALKESRNRLSNLMASLPGMVYRCANDPDWTMEFVSEGCLELTGYSAEDLLQNNKMSFNQLIYEEDRNRVWEIIQAKLRARQPYELEYRIKTVDNELKWVAEKGVGVVFKDNQCQTLEGFVINIDDRKKAEQALRESEEKYRRTMDSMGDAIHVIDRDFQIVLFNEAFKQLNRRFGLTTDCIGKNLFDVFPFLSEKIRDDYQCVLKSGETIIREEQNYFNDERILIETRKIPASIDGQVTNVITVVRDISSGQQAKQQIQMLHSQIEQFSRISANILTIKDDKILFDRISSAIVEISDFKRVLFYTFTDQFPYRNILGYRGIDSETAARLQKSGIKKENYERLFTQGIPLGEQSCYIPHTMKNILSGLSVDYGKGKYKSGENSWHAEDNLLVALKDNNNNFIGIISVDDSKGGLVPTDDTVKPLEIFANHISQIILLKRMEKEHEQMLDKLAQIEKIRGFGEIAGGVAHDFNNVLSSILGRAQLLRNDVHDPVIQQGLQIIEKAALDGAETIKRIQDFTRVRKDKSLNILEINQLIEDCILFTRNRWKDESEGKGIKIEIVRDMKENYLIKGNESELREVFTNLIINAIDAMPGGGRLSFSTRSENKYVYVTVKDTGLGMDEYTKKRAFDPFFTTKGVRGSGLGLSVTYSIISRHGGDINLKSEENQGTQVELKFQQAYLKTSVQLKDQKIEKVQPALSLHKILVIDDDEGTRELLKDILRMGGYQVHCAASGPKGLDIFQHEKDIGIVFTDLGMPEMSGWEVAERIKKLGANTVVVMITGWGNQYDEEMITEKNVDLLVAKPFQFKQVLELVKQCLKIRQERVKDSSDPA
jgi:PAS domain S-box-containing protein